MRPSKRSLQHKPTEVVRGRRKTSRIHTGLAPFINNGYSILFKVMLRYIALTEPCWHLFPFSSTPWSKNYRLHFKHGNIWVSSRYKLFRFPHAEFLFYTRIANIHTDYRTNDSYECNAAVYTPCHAPFMETGICFKWPLIIYDEMLPQIIGNDVNTCCSNH